MASKKTVTVNVKNVSVAYYPGSANKTIYVTWGVTTSGATSYTVAWQVLPYGSGGQWFAASTTTASTLPTSKPKDCPTFDIPQNCREVRALVRVGAVKSDTFTKTVKVTKTKKVNGKKKKVTEKVKKKYPKYKAGGWVTSSNKLAGYSTKSTTPGSPSIEIDILNGNKGKVKLENYNDTSGGDATQITFEVVRSCEGTSYSDTYKNLTISHGVVSHAFNASEGWSYKARAKAVPSKAGFTDSDWSAYGSEVSAGLAKVSQPPALKAEKKSGATVVRVEWPKVNGAKKYRIQYTTNKDYFDHDSGGQVTDVEVDAPPKSVARPYTYINSEIEAGHKYYFRVRAEGNNDVYGGWSENNSINLGTPPAAPTSWSLEDVGKVGGKVTLCWTHNSTDGSVMEKAYVAWKIGAAGNYSTQELTIQSQETDPDKVITTYAWDGLPTSNIPDSSTVYWKVRTKGIADDYGPYSTERSIKFYSPPTLQMSINENSVDASTLTGSTLDSSYTLITRFPINIYTVSGPQTQTPIGINYEIVTEEPFTVVVEDGTETYYAAGEVVFRHYTNIDTSGSAQHSQTLTLEPGNIFLQNAIHYTVRATIAMSNGLTATAERGIYPYWENATYDLSADINIDDFNLISYITPRCYELDSEIPITEGFLLSVYRREVNGSFVLISKNVDVADNITLIDVHPALDYARYRIVGINKDTGLVSFEDLPGEAIGEEGIVIQWDEEWRSIDEGMPKFDQLLEDLEDEDLPIGSLLKLPYNVDVNDDMGKEASLINYAGRTYPVSYYGTQRSLTSKWTVQVPKSDSETMNSIRRLAMFGGDSYVREPNGTGYWAALTVSYNITHDSPLIPVTFSITRVEGDDLGAKAKASVPEVVVVTETEPSP